MIVFPERRLTSQKTCMLLCRGVAEETSEDRVSMEGGATNSPQASMHLSRSVYT